MAVFLFGLLAFGVGLPAFAQVARNPSSAGSRSLHIEGYLLEEGDHSKPVKSARLVLTPLNSDTGQTGYSDDDGRFFFYELARGRYNLTVSAPGFASRTIGFELAEFSHDGVQIFLKRAEKRPSLPSVPAATLNANVPASARAKFEKGRKLLQEQKFKESIRALESALEEYAGMADGWSALGIACIQVPDLQRAEEAFHEALALEEDNAEALLGLGLVLNDRRQYARALSYLEKVAPKIPNDWQVHYELGRAQYRLDRLDEAEESLRRARGMNPKYGNLYLLLANVFVLREKYAEGLAEFEEFLRVAPQSPMAAQVKEKIRLLKAELGKP